MLCSADNGEIETFNAYRVQHDDSRGPYKGGLRYHPQVDLDDVRRCCFRPLILQKCDLNVESFVTKEVDITTAQETCSVVTLAIFLTDCSVESSFGYQCI